MCVHVVVVVIALHINWIFYKHYSRCFSAIRIVFAFSCRFLETHTACVCGSVFLNVCVIVKESFNWHWAGYAKFAVLNAKFLLPYHEYAACSLNIFICCCLHRRPAWKSIKTKLIYRHWLLFVLVWGVGKVSSWGAVSRMAAKLVWKLKRNTWVPELFTHTNSHSQTQSHR